MFLLLGVRWWYTAGWQWALHRSLTERVARVAETFSILPLMKTWFSPFKQTYSGQVKGSIDLRIQAFFDRTVSRVIGFLIRSVLIGAGLITSVLVVITGLLFLLAWPLIPFLPVISIVLMASGVGV